MIQLTAWSSHCQFLLEVPAPSKENREIAATIIAYLDQVMTEGAGTLEVEKLQQMLLEQNITLANPIHKRAGSRAIIHYEGLQRLLDLVGIDDRELKTEMIQWLEQYLEQIDGEQKQRVAASTKTSALSEEMKFIRIPPGSVTIMGLNEFMGLNELEKVEISENLAIMSTPITQKIWWDYTGERPSHFSDGESTMDHPVENITWWSAIEFANWLSELEGLRPVYDTSLIRWELGTRFENGSLQLQDGKIRYNLGAGGYRLPSVEELLYLSSLGIGDWTGHSWYDKNSSGTTHPVAARSAWVNFDDGGIHDLGGNVWEWSNAIYPYATDFRPMWGGSWNSSAEVLSDQLVNPHRAHGRYSRIFNSRGPDLGFRLIKRVRADDEHRIYRKLLRFWQKKTAVSY